MRGEVGPTQEPFLIASKTGCVANADGSFHTHPLSEMKPRCVRQRRGQHKCSFKYSFSVFFFTSFFKAQKKFSSWVGGWFSWVERKGHAVGE